LDKTEKINQRGEAEGLGKPEENKQKSTRGRSVHRWAQMQDR